MFDEHGVESILDGRLQDSRGALGLGPLVNETDHARALGDDVVDSARRVDDPVIAFHGLIERSLRERRQGPLDPLFHGGVALHDAGGEPVESDSDKSRLVGLGDHVDQIHVGCKPNELSESKTAGPLGAEVFGFIGKREAGKMPYELERRVERFDLRLEHRVAGEHVSHG